MADLINCKTCNQEIAKSAKVCPNCGAKNKKSRWLLKTLGGLFALFVLIGIFGGGSESEVEREPKPSEDQYSDAVGLDYRSAMLKELDDGVLMTFHGEVNQIVGNRGVRFATKENSFLGFSGDFVYLSFGEKPNILKEDVLRIKGRYDGVKTYETVLGASVTIPQVYVDYYSILEKRK